MCELKLTKEKAQQLGRIFAAMCGTQNSIIETLQQNDEKDVTLYVKWLSRKQKHMKHFLNNRFRIKVAGDEYYEGRLNAYVLALDLIC